MKMDISGDYTKLKYLDIIQKNKVKADNSLLKFEKDRKVEDNIIKDVINLFRLRKKIIKETWDSIVKNERHIFKSKKENKAIKERKIRDIRNLF